MYSTFTINNIVLIYIIHICYLVFVNIVKIYVKCYKIILISRSVTIMLYLLAKTYRFLSYTLFNDKFSTSLFIGGENRVELFFLRF